MGLSKTRALCAVLLVVTLLATAALAGAAELYVLSAGAMRSIVTDFAGAFEKETGNTVKLTFGTSRS
jgi:ABC-type molybdate transport system substrate-binding protein